MFTRNFNALSFVNTASYRWDTKTQFSCYRQTSVLMDAGRNTQNKITYDII
jgi:hypothetical protein